MKRAHSTLYNKEKDSSVFIAIMEDYKRAWEEANATLAVGLFTPNATYHEDPFAKRPLRGKAEIRKYWEEVPKFQRNVAFRYGPIYSSQNGTTWAAEWRAQYIRTVDDQHVRLKGTLFCKLSPSGKIERFWEYWHIKGKPSFGAESVQKRSTQSRKRSGHNR